MIKDLGNVTLNAYMNYISHRYLFMAWLITVFYFSTKWNWSAKQLSKFILILMPFLVNQDGFIEVYTIFYVTWKIYAFTTLDI